MSRTMTESMAATLANKVKGTVIKATDHDPNAPKKKHLNGS